MGLDSIFKPRGKLVLQLQENTVPGEVIPFDIRVSAEEEIMSREIRVELAGLETYYVTESYSDGKGNRRTRTVQRNELFAHIVRTVVEQPNLQNGSDQKWTSSLQLPHDALPTSSGKLVNIRWVVKGVLDVPKKGDLSEEKVLKVFSMTPQNAEISITPAEKSFGEVTLSLIVPPAATASRTLKGQLILGVKEKLNVRGIRVELVRIEEAGSRKADDVISSAQVSGEVSFNSGESPAFEFSLDLPASASPTAVGRHSSLGWKVRAVLDRKMKTDFNVEQGLRIYNAVKG